MCVCLSLMARAETTPDTMRALYKSILNGNMAEVKTQLCPAIMGDLSRPVTPRGDTILHAAISMKHEIIAREILKKCKQVPVPLLRKQNLMGDTVLHEAAATNMTSLAEYLLILDPDLLDMRNNLGETALFRAAHYGKAEMFELLADIFDKKNELEPKQKEAPDHLKRHDGTTIIFFT